MSFEGVTKVIKDERQPMGKRDTWSKMGGEKYSTGTGAPEPELVLSILLICVHLIVQQYISDKKMDAF